jgi:hypothetical protein
MPREQYKACLEFDQLITTGAFFVMPGRKEQFVSAPVLDNHSFRHDLTNLRLLYLCAVHARSLLIPLFVRSAEHYISLLLQSFSA